MIMSLAGCGNKSVSNDSVNNTPQAQVNNNIPAEYKQKTVNENDVTIYGKIVDENTASETGKKVIKANALGDKKQKDKGYTYTYSEYYSEPWGDTVIVKTGDKQGSKVIYNSDGNEFLDVEVADANVDLDLMLTNIKMGHKLYDAMDKVNGRTSD